MTSVPKASLVLRGRNAGIARIVAARDGSHVGMGIVVGPRSVLTCAHVVNRALDLRETATARPKEPLSLEFPLMQTRSRRVAVVEDWHPIDPGGAPGDVALLTLLVHEPDIDPAVGKLNFAKVTGRSIDNDEVCVYGILEGEHVGEHVAARFVGFAGGRLAQIDSSGEKGRLIRPGFSGGAVFDESEEAIVGLAQKLKVDSHRAAQAANADLPEKPTAALVLPTAQLAELVPTLPVEERARPAWWAAAWSISSVVLFMLYLAHVWVSQQGGGAIAQLAFETRHPQVAALYGMHVVLLGPVVAWLLLSYARDFARSPWSQRVPPFPFCRERWAPGPRPWMSLLVIAFFVIAPIYSQGHLLIKFHTEGNVYAHVKTFGEAAWGPPGPRDCLDGGFCLHPDAGRYSVVHPAPGAPGGYLDYVYKYGEPRQGLTLQGITFFPIGQPALLLAFSAWSLLLLARWGRVLGSKSKCGR